MKTAYTMCTKILCSLTHWDGATHICVGNLTIIGSDNGLSPDRRQAIIWTNAWILFIGTLGINFSKIFNGIQTFSFKNMHLKISSAKWRPFCIGLNVLTLHPTLTQCTSMRVCMYEYYTPRFPNVTIKWSVFVRWSQWTNDSYEPCW